LEAVKPVNGLVFVERTKIGIPSKPDGNGVGNKFTSTKGVPGVITDGFSVDVGAGEDVM
jgi:hypothetical protein